MAKDWGLPPWEIMDDPENKATWVLRRRVINHVTEQAYKDKQKR